MKVTAELSLYPLTSDYEASIISFIKSLKSNEDLTVLTHAMSTFVKGDINRVMEAIGEATSLLSNHSASLVIKLITRDLPIESGFLEF